MSNSELADKIDEAIAEKDDAYAAGDTAAAIKGTEALKKLTAKLRDLDIPEKPSGAEVEAPANIAIAHPPDPTLENAPEEGERFFANQAENAV